MLRSRYRLIPVVALAFFFAVSGPVAAAVIDGTPENDNLVGTPQADQMSGKAGDDTIKSLRGRDIVYGGDGNDTISLGAFADWARGGRGQDQMFGGRQDDYLNGGPGQDHLIDGAGNDVLVGGAGSDTGKLQAGRDQVDLGSGADIFDVYPDGMRDVVNCGTDGGTVYLMGSREGVDKYLHCGVVVNAFGASWQFNETSGSALDATGNGNNGTLHGGILRTGTGYDFDGSTGYVSVPDSPTLDPGSGNIALTVKFTLDGNPVPSGYDYDLVRKGLSTTSGGDYKAEVLSSGKGLCHFRGSQNSATITGGSSLGTGTHTLKCVKTSSSVQLLVDGSVKASKTITVGSISNGSGVPLGAKPGDDFTNGFIDYITITRD